MKGRRREREVYKEGGLRKERRGGKKKEEEG